MNTKIKTTTTTKKSTVGMPVSNAATVRWSSQEQTSKTDANAMDMKKGEQQVNEKNKT